MIRDVRGRGLILGIELDRPGRPVRRRGARAGPRRQLHGRERDPALLPPLTLSAAEVDEAWRSSKGCFAQPHEARSPVARRSYAGRLRDDLRARQDAEGRRAGEAQAPPPRRPDAGDDLREAEPAHARHVRDRHVPARRHAIYLAPGDIRLGERESVADIARNLSRWVDLIVARTFRHDTVRRARRATRSVPVINGAHRPATIPARCSPTASRCSSTGAGLDGLRVAFIGDGNNMVHSWMLAASALRHSTFAPRLPAGLRARHRRSSRQRVTARGATIERHALRRRTRCAAPTSLYTDVWTSMGQEAEDVAPARAFRGYQVNAATRARTPRPTRWSCTACRPIAARRSPTTCSTGRQSIVFDQAENRLHVQKAIMVWLAARRMHQRN